MELVCPAGSLPALKAAVDNGANAVYLGFRDATNARNFAGLNFGMDEIRAGCGTRAPPARRCSSPLIPIRARRTGRNGPRPPTAPPISAWMR